MSDIMILDLGATIKGNCTVDGYADKIIVQSFSHGASQPMQMDRANTERTKGRAVFSEMSFSKTTDVASPGLLGACAKATKLGKATLHVGRMADGKFMHTLKYELNDAMVSSFSTSGGGGQPSDSFDINFTGLKVEYTQQQTDNTKKGTSAFDYDEETLKGS